MERAAQRVRNTERAIAQYGVWVFGALVGLLWLVPQTSFAMVILSEIAWMGTDADANNEWIEIYNLSSTEADMTGWTITDGGAISITLAGTLPPHGVGILERTDDDTLPGTAFMIYTGALANDGGTLTLKDAGGTVADQASWPSIGGRNTVPKMTPQRTRTAQWVTGLPTPGADNVQVNDPSLTATTTEENTNTSTNTNTNANTTTTSNTSSNTARRSSGGSSTKKPFVPSTAALALAITAPTTAYVNAPVTFSATPSGAGDNIMNSLVYTWNFGDTYTGDGKKVSHTYAYPGEYVVVLHGVFSRHDVTVQKVITVYPVTVTIGRTLLGDITLTNTATYDIDISGHVLVGTKSLVFPAHSVIKSGQSLTIEKGRVDGVFASPLALYDGEKKRIASYGVAEQVSGSDEVLYNPSVVAVVNKASRVASSRTVVDPREPDVLRDDTDSTVEEVSDPTTIPLYQGASAGKALASESPLRSKLPYVGLVLIVIVGVLLLTTRKSGSTV